MTQINVVVGHEPVTYRRYGKTASVRSYTRNFMVITPEDADKYPDIAAKYALGMAVAECREWCSERIAYHRSGEHPIRYIRVEMPDKTVYQWSPSRGWVNKTEEK